MTNTLISSDKQEVTIGFDAPFCVIGERINPTGRKLLAAEMAEGNYDRVISDAVAQVEAGANMLDVNAGIPMADEPAILAESIKLVQDTVDVPLAIDSSIVAALEAGLALAASRNGRAVRVLRAIHCITLARDERWDVGGCEGAAEASGASASATHRRPLRVRWALG